jgi:HSP20 family protein
MKNNMLFNSDNLTYPGEYVPLCKESEVQRALHLSHQCKGLPPPVNITEMPDAYRIEVAMPGVERENILLLANGNIISVMVINNTCSFHEEESSQQHEFDYDCFSRDIAVAANADLEFTNAVCHSGMLRIYIPKSTTNSVNKGSVNIVVY